MKLMIAIGADHRGYQLKEFLKSYDFKGLSINWVDSGAYDEKRSDYPIFAKLVCKEILEEVTDLGVLICGTGTGMQITANRYPRIYAAIAWNKTIAKLSKEDDNANILVLPSDFVSNEQGAEIVFSWLQAQFKEGVYRERIKMIDQ